MSIRESYNKWSLQYDSNVNKTRDMEAQILRTSFATYKPENVLEIGCGTGKNTEWLVQKYKTVTSVDFSENMLAIAKAKVNAANVIFVHADITRPWKFVTQCYDLISFSLVLEHIENLHHIFDEAANALTNNGFIYISELHPFKQYSGSKARFETDLGTETLTCFTHHISEFTTAANNNGLQIVKIEEYFDDDIKKQLPRILTLLFQKKK